MEMRRLGSGGPLVSAIGLGCERMSAGEPAPGGVATIRAAIDAGVTLLDTADFYGAGHNEELIRRALRDGDRDRVVISDKFGAQRDPAGRFIGLDARPAHAKSALAYSLHRLGTDHVDIYRPARLDPAVPIEETVGAIAELVQAGWVRHIGLSEVGAETLRRAHAVHPIVDLQIEYSIFSRGPERAILDTCRELGVSVTAYGVLGHGMLTGAYAGGGEVGHLPRFHGANLTANLALVERLRAVAEARGVTVARLAIAWVLRRSEVVALVGTSRPERIADAVAAAGIVLTDAELAAIDEAVPDGAVAGGRYATPLLALLDSER
ncbi:aldo/keto reductase [Catenuloplanes atrovinosus]|uniref:Pyridoxine 4-dehydrogenase n=1 Tax=Catenuloplanes atrovinosus TaxID=137266 RepID=A0AAE3YMI6_9ACTN|nr:aldo/keto reductase [Catenuloplanes atrovinosus]MDR7275056.1 pyridoxine 4-dehydrogenase [Catenuloplanes atrovinosus]